MTDTPLTRPQRAILERIVTSTEPVYLKGAALCVADRLVSRGLVHGVRLGTWVGAYYACNPAEAERANAALTYPESVRCAS